LSQLGGDLATGVADADDQHPAAAKRIGPLVGHAVDHLPPEALAGAERRHLRVGGDARGDDENLRVLGALCRVNDPAGRAAPRPPSRVRPDRRPRRPRRAFVVESQCALATAGSGGLPSTRSAAFSAIISTQALMLPETRSGMAEASATRSPSTPRTRSAGSSTTSCPPPIAQVAQG